MNVHNEPSFNKHFTQSYEFGSALYLRDNLTASHTISNVTYVE